MFGWGKKEDPAKQPSRATVQPRKKDDGLLQVPGGEISRSGSAITRDAKSMGRQRSAVQRGGTLRRPSEERKAAEKEEEDDYDPFAELEERKSARSKRSDSEGSDFEVIDTQASIRRTTEKSKKMGFPEPMYKNVLKIGEVQGGMRIHQICKQLGIHEDNYMWWNSDDLITVHVPKELGGGPSWSSLNKHAAADPFRSKSVGVKKSNHKVIISKGKIHLFSVTTQAQLEKNIFVVDKKISGESSDDDVQQERIDKAEKEHEMVVGSDTLCFNLMDFEFMQRLKQPRNSFILKVYNKENTNNEQMPYIHFQCSTEGQMFTMTHLIERQLPQQWQAFFERELQIKHPDCYQYHCFVLKKNYYGSLQPRFFVISQLFLFNCKCSFNQKKPDKPIEFGESKWKVPIQALTKVVLKEEKEKKITMVLHLDEKMQNDILQKLGEKKVSKTQRDVEFSHTRRTTARDFLWHLKRIHHWWNCAGADNTTPPLEIKLS